MTDAKPEERPEPEAELPEAWFEAAFDDASEGSHVDVSLILRALRSSGGEGGSLVLPGASVPPPIRPSSPEMPPAPPASGRYQVFGEIAHGGMGAVILGRDVELGREVALKVLLNRHRGDPAMVQRFIEEAQIGGQLQHPGIVPVYESGVLPGDRPFFAMKLVQGKTLASLLADRATPQDDRSHFLGMFRQVCLTVAYAHSRGVIHRDLKPSNVMVGAFGEVQVMDWGLAKVLSSGGIEDDRTAGGNEPLSGRVNTIRSGDIPIGESSAGSVMGTYAYMAPEQARGEVDRLDERTDVFGLGAILLQILTGRPPFTGDTPGMVRLQATQGLMEASWSALETSSADPELRALVRRCLDPDQARRPRHAREVADAITAHLTGLEERAHAAEIARAGEAARAEEAEARVHQERRARRLGLSLAASVLLLLALGAGGWMWFDGQRRNRLADTESAIAQALEETNREWREAERLGDDLTAWTRALLAARRAEELAGREGVPDTTRAQVTRTAREIATEEGALRATAEQRRRDAATVSRLEAVRMRFADRWDAAATIDAYGQAFREHGIDLDADPQSVGAAISDSPIAADLVSALDEFLLAHERAGRPRPERLIAIMDAADSDPWRRKLREAASSADGDRLRALANEQDIAALAPAIAHRLGRSLLAARESNAAIRVLGIATARHPGDFWLRFEMGEALRAARPPRALEAVGSYEAAIACRPQSVAAWNSLGIANREAGRATECFAAHQKALELAPEDPVVLTSYAVGLYELSTRYHEAIELLERAIEVDEDRAEAWASLGVARWNSGDQDGAAAAFRRAVRLDPRNTGAACNLAVIDMIAKRVPAALEKLDAVLAFDDRDPVVHLNRGDCLWKLGREIEAIAAYERSLQLDPSGSNAPHALNNLAILARNRGDDEKALACYRRARSLDPAHVLAVTNLGRLLHDLGRDAEALEILEDLCERVPRAPKAHTALGFVRRLTGNLEAARSSFETALQIEPDHIDARLELATVHMSLGNDDTAEEMLRDLLSDHPASGAAWFNLGNLLADQHRIDEAADAYEAAARAHEAAAPAQQADPDPAAEAWNSLGCMHLELHDLEGAEEAFLAAHERGPARLLPVINLARVCHETGRPEEAASWTQTAEGLISPDTPVPVILELAALEDTRGDFDGAEKALRQVLARKPQHHEALHRLGTLLWSLGRLEDAATIFRSLILRDPEDTDAFIHLAGVLQDSGHLVESLAALRRAHALGTARPDRPHDSASWLARAERLLALAADETTWLSGSRTPADALERYLLARTLTLRGHPAAAIPHWELLFSEDPPRPLTHEPPLLLQAARAAIQAATSPGDLSPGDRTHFHALARQYLQRHLETLTASNPTTLRQLRLLQADATLAPVRTPPATATLPPPERDHWTTFWSTLESRIRELTHAH